MKNSLFTLCPFEHVNILTRLVGLVNTQTRQKIGTIYKKRIGKLVILPMRYISLCVQYLAAGDGDALARVRADEQGEIVGDRDGLAADAAALHPMPEARAGGAVIVERPVRVDDPSGRRRSPARPLSRV